MKSQSTKYTSIKEAQKEFEQQRTHEFLFGPEINILKQESDIYLDRLYLEIQLRDGVSKISDVIMTEPRDYEAIFHKSWFYRLADMLGVNRSVMDAYVKPKYVKDFFIKFVYGRFGYKVLRELKSARKLAKAYNAKLFQFLKDEYYKLIENISIEIYNEMEGKNFNQFVQDYSTKHKLPIQQTFSF
jgi:P63C domain